MREFRHRGYTVDYPGNCSGIFTQRVNFEGVGGRGAVDKDQGEAGATELSARLPAAEQPLPGLESMEGGRWKNEPYILEEL